MAVVIVPAEQVLDVVDPVRTKGSAGHRSHLRRIQGDRPEGAEREAAVLAKVRNYGMRMMGPNCMGLINTDPEISLNATFSPVFPPKET